MYEFTIELAGIPIRIRCRYEENRKFFREYLSEKKPLVEVEAQDADLRRIQEKNDALSRAEGSGKEILHQAYLENNAIHEQIAEKLTEFQVLLLHGSALCMDGSACIFIASSGTGKSTHARLWRQTFGSRVWMINDDKPLLRMEEEKAVVYGSPWNGKHCLGSNACAPLKAVVHLMRDPQNSISPLPGARAYELLMKHAFWSEKPQVRWSILALQKKILECVDFYELHCNMSPEAARTAWEGLQPWPESL